MTPSSFSVLCRRDFFRLTPVCRFWLVMITLLVWAVPGSSGETPAESFGLTTRGGYGGQIIKVTNLDNDGPGSFRAAITADGPRIVVFEVGGVIDLEKDNIDVHAPYLTIAGQTAPSPGITLIRGGITFRTHDVIVQHIRIRPGDAGEPGGSGWEPDGMGTTTSDDRVPHNLFFGNCSISWGVDENTSVSGPVDQGPYDTSYNITFYRCIISEALKDSTHSKGDHSMGMLVHDYARNVAVIENIFASNESRNPRFKMATTGVIVNNVISNPGGKAIDLKYSSDTPEGTPEATVAVVGNVLYQGPDSPWDMALINGRGRLLLEDNEHWLYYFGLPGEITDGDFTELQEPPLWPEGLRPLPAADVLDHLALYAGARPADRDAIDARVIQEVRDLNGSVIDSQDEVGGYPEFAATYRALNPPNADDAQAVDQWLRDHAAQVTPTGWERVRARHYAPVRAVDYETTDPAADNDRDGLSARLELLLGTDPDARGDRERQPMALTRLGDGDFAFEYRHDPVTENDLGKSLQPMFSTDDMSTWSTTLPTGLQEIQRRVTDDGLEKVVFEADPSVLEKVSSRLEVR